VIPSKKRIAKMRSEKPCGTCHQDAIGSGCVVLMQDPSTQARQHRDWGSGR
jgi:hypothetical protein